ncbi:AAA domain-containing protein (plasmid) [Rubrobacter tropicus]|uniref:AAA domain-containing protein n=1 Tax=Rubrobacter tropicus TaxID=2653851 RepID=A0A6G8QGA3_9ACTN|nr:AAA family ATPase [Rubrobacter tropicus]QIN85482.1 AAA domain-containing protein [Rubrobacter tropicus]
MQAAENTPQQNESPREKLLRAERSVSERVFEREVHIRGLSVGILARAHVLLLGPKGCAKSALSRLYCDLIAWDGVPEGQDPYFRTQLRPASTEDEIYGPVSNAGFEDDTFRRNTTGMVPRAKLAVLEELYTAGSLLKSLLTIMNEGLFKNGTLPEERVPLRLLIATSNDVPADRDENLDAFHDRFLLRYQVDYLQDRRNVRKMMERANSSEAAAREAVSPILTERDVDAAIQEARKVDVSPVFDAIDEILAELADREIVPSDRRREALVHLVKAQAYMNGRTAATRADLDILAHALWEDPDGDQIRAVAEVVLRQANPHAAEARDRFDRATDSYNNAMRAHREAARNPGDEALQRAESDAGMNANVALKQTTDKLLELRDAAKTAGADTGLIDGLLKKVLEMNEEVTSKCLGI